MTTVNNIERLFKEHYAQLYSLAFVLLKDEAGAHDVVHDVFTDLLHSGEWTDKGKGYLLRCVRNRCLNIMRETPVRESVERLMMTEGMVEYMGGDNEYECLENIRRIIAEDLTLQCSRVMRLRYETGLTYKEIAEELGISKASVYKHLKNGLDCIRGKLTF